MPEFGIVSIKPYFFCASSVDKHIAAGKKGIKIRRAVISFTRIIRACETIFNITVALAASHDGTGLMTGASAAAGTSVGHMVNGTKTTVEPAEREKWKWTRI